MTDAKDQAQSLFLNALEIPTAGERAAYVKAQCGADSKLRKEVEELLDHARRLGPFLEPDEEGVDSTIVHPITEHPGTVIGPYKLLQQIGEGGMGVVFMAEQTEPLQRTVALKIIKPGMDTRQVIARFEAERQAVAMMDHPNIARVLDAGTTDTGRPFFVMDLVKGVPITDYCDHERLSVRERLDLFTQVCHAVQHAHQKGIIHRDLKPSNVLVAEYDGKPVPKIIDFGVAKATAQKLTEKTMFTEYGQLVGTFEYMSPEQARFNQLDVDTRSDIYSLGVLLYELLAGSTPLEKERLRSAAFNEILRMIGEEEPPKPSTRLSSSDALPSIAANRNLEPKKLSGLVRGELDWIVMKSLEKDRTRRYETANGLAADIQHYLDDEPVQACPPSAAYRFRKYARRHKAALAVTGLVTTLLVAAVVFLTVNNARIRHASAAKDAALVTARQAVDQMLTRVADERLINVPLAEPLRKALWEDALRFYEVFLQGTPSSDASRSEMFEVLRNVGNIQLELGRGGDARNSQERGIELIETLVASHPNEPTYREQLAGAHLSAAITLCSMPTAENVQEAEAHLYKSLQICEDLTHDFPDRPQQTSSSLRILGDLADDRGNLIEARRLYRQAVQQRESYALSTNELQAWINVCWDCHVLAKMLEGQQPDERAEAEKLLRNGIDATDKALAIEPNSRSARYAKARTSFKLVAAYRDAGRVEEAIGLSRQSQQDGETLCANYPWVADHWGSLNDTVESLVGLLQTSGRGDEAKQVLRDASQWLERVAQQFPDDPKPQSELMLFRCRLVMLLLSVGQQVEVRELLREASQGGPSAEAQLSNLPAGRFALAMLRLLTAFEDLLNRQPSDGEVQLARRLFEQAAEQFNRRSLATELINDFPMNSDIYVKMAGLLSDVPGRAEDISLVHAQLMALHAMLVVDAPPRQLWCCKRIGHRLRELGYLLQTGEYLAQAEAVFRDALGVWQGLMANAPHDAEALHYLADTYRCLANILVQTGRSEEAESLYRQSVAIYTENESLVRQQPFNESEVVASYFELAAFLTQSNRLDEATEFNRQGCEFLEAFLRPEPSYANGYNGLAWRWATSRVEQFRDPTRAVELATQAVELAPTDGKIWNTLGVAQYRANEWQTAIDGLQKSMDLRKGGDASDWFFLAMANWQLGHKDEARKWFDKSVEWMDKNQPKNEELIRFRAEAAELLGITQPQPSPKAKLHGER